MIRAEQIEMARAFLARHRSRPILVLPNVWDAMSARAFAAAGFGALATTSGGVAWALGYPDGEVAPWDEVVAATARIVRAARVPVTADIESGYGATPAEVGRHIADIVATGVVGVNLEDSLPSGGLRETADAAARIAAARAAAGATGVPIVINARCDIFHKSIGIPESRFDAALERSRAYLAAGADCIYPIGLRDAGTIAAFVKALGAPVNITGRPGLPDASTFERMGVARITLATQTTLVALSAIRTLAAELFASGGFDSLKCPLHHPDAQAMFE